MAANDARKPTTMAWHCTQHTKSTAYAYSYTSCNENELTHDNSQLNSIHAM